MEEIDMKGYVARSVAAGAVIYEVLDPVTGRECRTCARGDTNRHDAEKRPNNAAKPTVATHGAIVAVRRRPRHWLPAKGLLVASWVRFEVL
jgi:hypothetical protein